MASSSSGKATGLRALYLYYCYKLKIIVKQPASVKRVSADLRDDLVKLDQLIAQSRFLTANRIDTQQELDTAKQKIQAQILHLTQQRLALRNALKQAPRRNDPEQIADLKAQIRILSAAIRDHRKEVSICDDIAQRSGAVKNNLEQIVHQQNKQGKENMDHEYNKRRSGTGRSIDAQWR